MTREIINLQSLRLLLYREAKSGQWQHIDRELLPKLKSVDGNKMAKALLRRVLDKNPNIRDLVATCLPHLKISDERVILTAVEAMIKIASHDQEIFPAGRAALFLFNQSNRDDEIGVKIKQALATFVRRVKENSWEGQIKRDIPDLVNLLSLS